MQSDDYGAGQNLPSIVREPKTQLIRSISVRDSEGRYNIAILDPTAFVAREPTLGQTWHLRLERGQLHTIAAFPCGGKFAFEPESFGLPALG